MAERLTDEQLDKATEIRRDLRGICDDAFDALRHIDEEGDEYDDLEALEEALSEAEDMHTQLDHALTHLSWLVDEVKKARKSGPRGGETP